MKPCNFLAVLTGNLKAVNLPPNVFTILTTPIFSAKQFPSAYNPTQTRRSRRRTVNENSKYVSSALQLFWRCRRRVELDLVVFQSGEEGQHRFKDARYISLHDAIFVFCERCADQVR